MIREKRGPCRCGCGVVQDGVMNIIFKLAKMDPGSIKVSGDTHAAEITYRSGVSYLQQY